MWTLAHIWFKNFNGFSNISFFSNQNSTEKYHFIAFDKTQESIVLVFKTFTVTET